MSLAATNSSELDLSDSIEVLQEKATDLTEDELRKIYEDGEIRRFMHVFSSYVSEVKAMDISIPGESPRDSNPSEQSLSESIAQNWLEPLLPNIPQISPSFTMGKVRLTAQRLYLAAQTAYIPFIVSTYHLATWKNPPRSFIYCVLFWILWWHNYLLPAFVLLPVLLSVGHRLQPYPQEQQLRDYQRQILEADQFGTRVSEGISSSSTLDVKELWRLFKLANRTRKLNLASNKAKSPPRPFQHVGSSAGALNAAASSEEDVISPLSDTKEDKELRDLKVVLLHAITGIADLHERIQNIFLWRNPAASKRYTTVRLPGVQAFFHSLPCQALLGIFVATLAIPTQYLGKIVWFLLGAIFWHVAPIANGLSRDGRSRIPPLFADVPTDADYAMHLISQRVAAGQDILPSPRKSHTRSKSEEPKPNKPFYSRGIGEIGKKMTDEAYRIQKVASEVNEGLKIHLHPLLSNALAVVLPDINSEVYTYACQCGSTPGLITLTNKRLHLTPIFSETTKEVVLVENISGVRKTGLLKGLLISWERDDGRPEELKLSWVANREELFARLVGLSKRQWKSI